MRKYIRHIAAVFLLTVLLSGCSGPKPNPYETEELVSKNAGPAVFAVPRSWDEGAGDAEGFRYYFETEDVLLNLQTGPVYFSNEEFIRSGFRILACSDTFFMESTMRRILSLTQRKDLHSEIIVSSLIVQAKVICQNRQHIFS